MAEIEAQNGIIDLYIVAPDNTAEEYAQAFLDTQAFLKQATIPFRSIRLLIAVEDKEPSQDKNPPVYFLNEEKTKEEVIRLILDSITWEE